MPVLTVSRSEYVSSGHPAHPIEIPPIYVPIEPPPTGEGGGKPEHPIYIPIYPEHPIYIVPPTAEHPIYLPSPGTPEHPIYLPIAPSHPIAPGGEQPSHPIAPGGER